VIAAFKPKEHAYQKFQLRAIALSRFIGSAFKGSSFQGFNAKAAGYSLLASG
jgi:hypothetical protein